ncbi:STAS domain-containing protein [Streptomyces sp. NPDC090306]|uniref:STAS domain-containing protein n=1 Tax=unclassified Streptomyces TaxID=2593676 RepID=UPI0036E74CDC
MFEIGVWGEVDLSEDDLLAAAWDEADECRLRTTLVDLSGVVFADSALLNSLILAHYRHQRDGRRFILAGPLHPAVVRLLRVSGTQDLFTMARDRERALELSREG